MCTAGDSLDRTLSLLSSSEEHETLARALAALGQMHLDRVHADRANVEFYKVAEPLRDHIFLIEAVKVRTLHHYIHHYLLCIQLYTC